MAAARVGCRRRAPVAGGEKGRAAEVPHSTAHLLVAAASGGDGASGAAARLEKADGGGGEFSRGDDATEHGRGRERGQTKEDDEVKLFISIGLKSLSSKREELIRED
jgi:Domain of unknown function (DUF834).